MAAPKATTSSGFMVSLISVLKKFVTAFFTAGTLVLPPTKTTVSISFKLSSTSFIAFVQHSIVFRIKGSIKLLKVSTVIDN